jgi:hypothetical protein
MNDGMVSVAVSYDPTLLNSEVFVVLEKCLAIIDHWFSGLVSFTCPKQPFFFYFSHPVDGDCNV